MTHQHLFTQGFIHIVDIRETVVIKLRWLHIVGQFSVYVCALVTIVCVCVCVCVCVPGVSVLPPDLALHHGWLLYP